MPRAPARLSRSPSSSESSPVQGTSGLSPGIDPNQIRSQTSPCGHRGECSARESSRGFPRLLPEPLPHDFIETQREIDHKTQDVRPETHQPAYGSRGVVRKASGSSWASCRSRLVRSDTHGRASESAASSVCFPAPCIPLMRTPLNCPEARLTAGTRVRRR